MNHKIKNSTFQGFYERSKGRKGTSLGKYGARMSNDSAPSSQDQDLKDIGTDGIMLKQDRAAKSFLAATTERKQSTADRTFDQSYPNMGTTLDQRRFTLDSKE